MEHAGARCVSTPCVFGGGWFDCAVRASGLRGWLSDCAVRVGVWFSSESHLRRTRGAVLERVQCGRREIASRTKRGHAQRSIPVDPSDGDDACVTQARGGRAGSTAKAAGWSRLTAAQGSHRHGAERSLRGASWPKTVTPSCRASRAVGRERRVQRLEVELGLAAEGGARERGRAKRGRAQRGGAGRAEDDQVQHLPRRGGMWHGMTIGSDLRAPSWSFDEEG